MAPPQVDDEYRTQIRQARQDLTNLISEKDYYPSLMLRLAFHDAGIYDFTGDKYLIKKGPNGSIRTKEELKHPLNEGLEEAVVLCEEVKRKAKKVTYADLYQLAGIVAVDITDGPKIKFVPGREDASSTHSPEEGFLPNGKLDESQLKKISKRMGLEEKDIVALYGGLYRWDFGKIKEESDKGKPAGDKSTAAADTQELKESAKKRDQEKKEALKFDNSYFKKLLENESDSALLHGEFRKYVQIYAKNKTAFFEDYAAAHEKMSQLDMKGEPAKSAQDGSATAKSVPASWNRARLVQGIGIAVVTTAVILGFFFSRRSK